MKNLRKLIPLKLGLAGLLVVMLSACGGNDKDGQPQPKPDIDPDVTNVTITEVNPSTPNTLENLQLVEVSFDYNVVEAFGTRIFFFPFTDGDYTPGYVGSLSPVYKGTGSDTKSFTLQLGDQHVDQILILVKDRFNNIELYKFYYDVEFTIEKGNENLIVFAITPDDEDISYSDYLYFYVAYNFEDSGIDDFELEAFNDGEKVDTYVSLLGFSSAVNENYKLYGDAILQVSFTNSSETLNIDEFRIHAENGGEVVKEIIVEKDVTVVPG